jgi:hypothetical protein
LSQLITSPATSVAFGNESIGKEPHEGHDPTSLVTNGEENQQDCIHDEKANFLRDGTTLKKDSLAEGAFKQL